ncbi:MAG: hypothetical protein RLZZ251_552 [Actinomycetota bacterium]
MDQAKEESQVDLTATIHIGSLRSVSDPVASLLDGATQEEREVLSNLPSGCAMLIALGGPARGSRFLLDKAVTKIGRSTENDIFLDDITVSRKHVLIERFQDGFSFRDLGSLNGTYLDGQIASKGQLKDGSELQIGKFRLHFFLGGGNKS